MSCVEKLANIDSEMEEGEIVDDVEDLSDVSSEEEYLLLRKRLQVLENYNNVLERTKAKRSSIRPGVKYKKPHNKLPDLSEISATELNDCCDPHKNNRHTKAHQKPKRRKEQETNNNVGRYKDKRKNHRNKRKLEVKVINESSEESEDEYRNSRRKLANAVNFNKQNSDKSSLSTRLKKMLYKVDDQDLTKSMSCDKQMDDNIEEALSPISDDPLQITVLHDQVTKDVIEDSVEVCELIDISTDEDIKMMLENGDDKDTVDSAVGVKDATNINKNSEKDSDEDLELLRQHALKTKTPKQKSQNDVTSIQETKILSEDEDSDTTELRLICLKSALLKKAIERKQKQKLIKRLSQSSNLQDELLQEQTMLLDKIDSDNNTDIEYVDMDIGSDGDEKAKETQDITNECSTVQNTVTDSNENNTKEGITNVPKEEEFDEDEDLLRAKLLTSLTKNLPNLISPIINTTEEAKITNNTVPAPKLSEAPQKRFIINVGESDSEGEHEATKNLTKMHMKLSNPIEFQQRLDVFLKTTRMEVETTKLPDVIQKPPPKKFVAKAVNHLPKSEQIEYKNLVKRMAELEKIKQVRQSSLNLGKTPPVKDTLKPRNVAVDIKVNPITNLEDQIAMSRKKIAEESAKMLKLKEEGTKLSQKYKIVATELFNVTTAITLNKKHQRALHNSLTKIRLHHQSLLKSSTMTKHSNINSYLPQLNKISTSRLQKENTPAKEDYTNLQMLKNFKVSVANDIKDEAIAPNTRRNPPIEDYKNLEMLKNVKVSVANDIQDEAIAPNTRLSVQLDVTSNKKVVNLPRSPVKDRVVDIKKDDDHTATENNERCKPPRDDDVANSDTSHLIVEKIGETKYKKSEFIGDYKSPLEALGNTNWEADPNAILCPFEVCGDCKDADCKYLHTNVPTNQ